MDTKELIGKYQADLKAEVEKHNKLAGQIQEAQKKLKEYQANVISIEGGLKSLQELAKETGPVQPISRADELVKERGACKSTDKPE